MSHYLTESIFMQNIVHHPEDCTFKLDDTADSARLDYEQTNSHSVNFTSTYVPFRLRGKGIAEQLVKTGLQWAEDNKLSITTSCWYVEKYMAEQKK